MRHGPLFEITFSVAEDVIVEHESWLANQIREALRLAGVRDCQRFSIPDDEPGRKGRVCQFVLNDDEALDEFIDGFGAEMVADAAGRFGDNIDASDRVLREDKAREIPKSAAADCLNCGAHLRGQYCGHCGQRSRSRLISLWELIRDAFGDLFELDSRLWQTLVPLMIRPGLLTHDYLQGRRARYMPPFRMYLVLSVLFFLVAFFDPQQKLGVLFEPEAETPTSEDAGEIEQAEREILDELAADGIVFAECQQPGVADEDCDKFKFQFDDSDSEDDCDVDDSALEDLPGWLSRRLTPERVRQVCEKIQLDDGRAMTDNLIDNIPAALIILLPLMAFVLKALYPLSRRYYVEHLLFFVHFHAFFFLILTIQILFVRMAALLLIPDWITTLLLVIASFYIPVYLFVSMRRVYRQGRAITFLKYVVLTVAYASGFLAIMLGAVAIAAFSI
jgi:hypothetical protein